MNTYIKYLFCFIVAFVFSFCHINAQEDQKPVPTITKSKTIQKVGGKNFYVHIVEQGQTLFSISRAYNAKFQDAVIKTDIDKLGIGDTVWIPTIEQETKKQVSNDPYYKYYEVQQGETLYGIAKRFNTKESDIIALNSEVETLGLKAGQIIKIPHPSKETTNIQPPKPTTAATPAPVTKPTEPAKQPEVVQIKTDTSKVIIKDLNDKSKICVGLLMPFYLEEASNISVSKLDIEQKRKTNNKSFEFIQFYEGILLALDKLEKQGYNVDLKVYNVGDNNSEDVKSVFAKEEFKQVDFIIALLFQKAFETAATLAMERNTFIVNPLSNRSAILENNPYVIKVDPSANAYALNALSLISANFKQPNIFIIHSNKPSEAPLYNAFKTVLDNQKNIPYTLFNWAASSSLASHMKADKSNIIISIYDDKSLRSPIFANGLLNRLYAMRGSKPILFGPSYWLEFENIDYTYMQRLNFHFERNPHIDYQNPTHKEFVDVFKNTYKTEPTANLAGLGYDIGLHFITGLKLKGKAFWDDPNIPNQSGILNPFLFKRNTQNNGFENTKTYFYKLDDYQVVPAEKIK